MIRGAQKYYYHTNSLGSVTEITNSSGAVVEHYQYDAYGKPSIFDANWTQMPASIIYNRFMFTGREYDYETGFYYYRARYYDPTTGRFLQRDPKGYHDSMCLYQYCKANPANYLDPFGAQDKAEGVPKPEPKQDKEDQLKKEAGPPESESQEVSESKKAIVEEEQVLVRMRTWQERAEKLRKEIEEGQKEVERLSAEEEKLRKGVPEEKEKLQRIEEQSHQDEAELASLREKFEADMKRLEEAAKTEERLEVAADALLIAETISSSALFVVTFVKAVTRLPALLTRGSVLLRRPTGGWLIRISKMRYWKYGRSYELLQIRGLFRLEAHSIAPWMRGWLYYPHMHIDFLLGAWKLHIPIIEPVAAYMLGRKLREPLKGALK